MLVISSGIIAVQVIRSFNPDFCISDFYIIFIGYRIIGSLCQLRRYISFLPCNIQSIFIRIWHRFPAVRERNRFSGIFTFPFSVLICAVKIRSLIHHFNCNALGITIQPSGRNGKFLLEFSKIISCILTVVCTLSC